MKKILSTLLVLALPLIADQAVPPTEDEVIVPAEAVEYTPPEEKKSSSSWKTAGMVLFTIVTLTAGIAVASSNNGSSV
ncbi:MAG: hypothetical protein ChlgKO_07390 [Chlamydiales bacterium]